MAIRKAPTKNFISTTLNGAIDDAVTTITLASTANLQAPGAIVIDRVDGNGVSLPNSREVVEYLVINGNDLEQCIRGADNSTARSHSDGALVETNVTVGTFNSLISAILTVADANGYLSPLASPASLAIIQNTTFLNTSIASIAQLMIKTRLDLSGASITGLYPSNASGSILQLSGAGVPVAIPNLGLDGWTQSNDTWTYVSASTFKISGVDRTSVYTKGTRLKFTNSTLKYAVVIASSFSTDTTITIAVNNDYVIANAAITSPYYSYQVSPQGYPTWFNWTPTYTGFSANPTMLHRYKIEGTNFTLFSSITGAGGGTSNSTSMSITLPITISNQSGNNWLSWIKTLDNSAEPTTPGEANLVAGSTSAILRKTPGVDASWTASGTKAWWGIISCEF